MFFCIVSILVLFRANVSLQSESHRYFNHFFKVYFSAINSRRLRLCKASLVTPMPLGTGRPSALIIQRWQRLHVWFWLIVEHEKKFLQSGPHHRRLVCAQLTTLLGNSGWVMQLDCDFVLDSRVGQTVGRWTELFKRWLNKLLKVVGVKLLVWKVILVTVVSTSSSCLWMFTDFDQTH